MHAVSSASASRTLFLLLLTSAIYCSHVGDADQSLFLAIVASNCLVQSLLCLISLSLLTLSCCGGKGIMFMCLNSTKLTVTYVSRLKIIVLCRVYQGRIHEEHTNIAYKKRKRSPELLSRDKYCTCESVIDSACKSNLFF